MVFFLFLKQRDARVMAYCHGKLQVIEQNVYYELSCVNVCMCVYMFYKYPELWKHQDIYQDFNYYLLLDNY